MAWKRKDILNSGTVSGARRGDEANKARRKRDKRENGKIMKEEWEVAKKKRRKGEEGGSQKEEEGEERRREERTEGQQTHEPIEYHDQELRIALTIFGRLFKMCSTITTPVRGRLSW